MREHDAADRADCHRLHLSAVMNRNVFAACLAAAILLIWAGFRFDGLPFIPGARFSDAVISHFPAALYFHESVAEGNGFPIWRETILAGHPFAANPLNKTAYPPQWLAVVLPPLLHLNLMILLHIGIAFWGMLRWTRAVGLRDEAAFFAAFAYALSPRLIAHTGAGHLDVLYALAWFPWLMFAVNRFFTIPEKPMTGVLRLGMFAGLLILSDVRVSLFAGALAVGYALSFLLRERSGKRLIGIAAAGVCTALLTVSVILPLLAWMPYLTRSGLTAGDAGLISLQPAQLIGLIFAPQSGSQETLTYACLIVLILALIAIFSQPRRHTLWIIALLASLIYALGQYGGVWNALTGGFPFLLWFRVPARAWFVAVLVLPFLAGHGLQTLMDRVGRRQLLYLILGAGLVSGGLFALLGGAMPPGMAVGLLTSGVFCFAALLYQARRFRPAQFAAIAFTLAAVDLVYNGHQWMQWRDQTQWLPLAQVELAEALLADQPGRIYSPTYTLEQQTAAVYDLNLFGGIDPFQINAVTEAIRAGGGIAADGYRVEVPPLIGMEGDAIETANRAAIPDTAILGAWSVTHVVSAYPLDVDQLELATQVAAGYIYVNLNPALVIPVNTIPAWSEWSGLPSDAQVSDNNNLTMLAAAVSAIGFVMVVILLVVYARRGR